MFRWGNNWNWNAASAHLPLPPAPQPACTTAPHQNEEQGGEEGEKKGYVSEPENYNRNFTVSKKRKTPDHDYDDAEEEAARQQLELESTLRFLRSTEGIAEAIRDIRQCIKTLRARNKADPLLERFDRTIMVLNTAKDRLTKDTKISQKAAYIHRRTKRLRRSLIAEEENNKKKAATMTGRLKKVPVNAADEAVEPLLKLAKSAEAMDPEPANGKTYTLDEAVQILKTKKQTTGTIRRWKQEGKMTAGLARVQALVREQKDRDMLKEMNMTHPSIHGNRATVATPANFRRVSTSNTVGIAGQVSVRGNVTPQETPHLKQRPQEVVQFEDSIVDSLLHAKSETDKTTKVMPDSIIMEKLSLKLDPRQHITMAESTLLGVARLPSTKESIVAGVPITETDVEDSTENDASGNSKAQLSMSTRHSTTEFINAETRDVLTRRNTNEMTAGQSLLTMGASSTLDKTTFIHQMRKPTPMLLTAADDVAECGKTKEISETSGEVVRFDQIQNPLEKDGTEPPPENGEHYDMFEAVSILKFKTYVSPTIQKWISAGNLKYSKSTVNSYLKKAKNTNVMPKRGNEALQRAPYKKRKKESNILPKVASEEAKEDIDPEPANGEYYDLHEAVTILLPKNLVSKTMERWKREGKIRSSTATIYKFLKAAKLNGVMPDKGYTGSRTVPARCYKFPNAATLTGAMPEKEHTSDRTVPRRKIPPSPKAPPEVDCVEDDPEPVNGEHYSLYEIVTTLLPHKKFHKKVSRWIREGKVLCGKATIRRAMRKAIDRNIMPRKGNYGNVVGNRSIVEISKIKEFVGLSTLEEVKAKLCDLQKQDLRDRGLPLTRFKEPATGTAKNYFNLATVYAEGGDEKDSDDCDA